MEGKTEDYAKAPFRALVEKPNEALELIYDLYGLQLRAYVRSFFADDKRFVQDVILETLTVLWQKRAEVAELDEPFFWMLRVARNNALHILRQEARYRTQPIEDLINMELAVFTDSGQDAKELTEHILEISKTQLTASEQEIFYGSKFEGLSHEELMERHGLAEQTVKNKLAAALKKMRHALKDVLKLLV